MGPDVGIHTTRLAIRLPIRSFPSVLKRLLTRGTIPVQFYLNQGHEKTFCVGWATYSIVLFIFLSDACPINRFTQSAPQQHVDVICATSLNAIRRSYHSSSPQHRLCAAQTSAHSALPSVGSCVPGHRRSQRGSRHSSLSKSLHSVVNHET